MIKTVIFWINNFKTNSLNKSHINISDMGFLTADADILEIWVVDGRYITDIILFILINI